MEGELRFSIEKWRESRNFNRKESPTFNTQVMETVDISIKAYRFQFKEVEEEMLNKNEEEVTFSKGNWKMRKNSLSFKRNRRENKIVFTLKK